MQHMCTADSILNSGMFIIINRIHSSWLGLTSKSPMTVTGTYITLWQMQDLKTPHCTRIRMSLSKQNLQLCHSDTHKKICTFMDTSKKLVGLTGEHTTSIFPIIPSGRSVDEKNLHLQIVKWKAQTTNQAQTSCPHS